MNSCVVYQSQPEYAGYKLSKGALKHLASSLANELGPQRGAEELTAPLRHEQPGDGAEDGQEQAFGEELPGEPRAADA